MDTSNKVIKIGIYIPGDGLSSVDMTNPGMGNPGVGGTQYCMLLLAYYLALKPAKYKVCIISKQYLNLPTCLSNLIINSFDDLLNYDSEVDVLLLKTPKNAEDFDVLSHLLHTRVITWSHNYLYGSEARMVYNCKSIALNVFVGKQMYDFYIDNDIIKKSIYIYNIVPDCVGECDRTPEPCSLTFVGQISEAKGILDLMKIWSIVEKKCPEAVLNVIGGGNLYNRSVRLGKLNITDEKTERKLYPYILDENGKQKTNIRFYGILGKEKYDVFLRSSVGIVNPSARTETFGMGIIEMATAKLPVVTRNKNGHPDTALHNHTALLGNSIHKMAEYICKLFFDTELNYRLGENGKTAAKRFSAEEIVPIWESAIRDVVNNKIKPSKLHISSPIANNYKYLRAFNRILRFNLQLKFLPSVVEVESFGVNFIRGMRQRLLSKRVF